MILWVIPELCENNQIEISSKLFVEQRQIHLIII